MTSKKEGLKLLGEIEKQKATTAESANRPAHQKKTVKEHFEKQDRDDAIIFAIKDGYTQAKIAKFIGVSRPLACKIVKQKQRIFNAS
jgi:2-C-methyl-D-erythritol 4-phosphate cytidylyltransferase